MGDAHGHDIAFGVWMLAIVGASPSVAMRTFLLVLAVVDDLITMVIIPFFYTDDLHVLYLLPALVPLGLYASLMQKFPDFFMQHHWAVRVVLLPIGVITWLFVPEAGIYATIAGGLLGFMVSVQKDVPRVIGQEEPELALAGPSSTGSGR